MTRPASTLFAALPLAALLLADGPLAGSARSQEARGVIRPADTGVIDFGIAARKRIEAVRMRRKAILHNYLQLRIDDIDRVARLTPQQRKRLELAARGAVEHALDKWFREMLERQARFRARMRMAELEPGNGAPREERADRPEEGRRGDTAAPEASDVQAEGAEGSDAALAKRPADGPPEGAGDEAAGHTEGEENTDGKPDEATAVRARGIDVRQGPIAVPLHAPAGQAWLLQASALSIEGADEHIDAVASEKVWTHAIETVLTEPQKDAYQRARQRRQAFRRKAAVNQIVAMLDEPLLLSQQQRRELAKVIDQAMGDRILEPVAGVSQVAMIMELGIHSIKRRLPKDRIESILSPAQRRRWDTLGESDVPRSIPMDVLRPGPAAAPPPPRVPVDPAPHPYR